MRWYLKLFDKAVKANPGAHPIFHSTDDISILLEDFIRKLEEAGMVQRNEGSTLYR